MTQNVEALFSDDEVTEYWRLMAERISELGLSEIHTSQVDAKFKRLEEARAISPPAGAADEKDDAEDDEEEKAGGKGAKKKKKKKPKKVANGKPRKKGPPQWKHLLKKQAELRELQVRSLGNKPTWLAVLHPCEALKVKRKLAAELGIAEWRDIRLVYMGQLLADEQHVPAECYDTKRFNFLRWLDAASAQAYLAKLRKGQEKGPTPEEIALQTPRERRAQAQAEKDEELGVVLAGGEGKAGGAEGGEAKEGAPAEQPQQQHPQPQQEPVAKPPTPPDEMPAPIWLRTAGLKTGGGMTTKTSLAVSKAKATAARRISLVRDDFDIR